MTDLEARYGRKKSAPSARRKLRWAVVIALFTVAVTAFWALTTSSDNSVEAQNIGFSALDDSTVEIRFQLAIQPGTEVTCAIEALDQRFGIVGWREVELPVSQAVNAKHTVTLRTVSKAASGAVSRCWAT